MTDKKIKLKDGRNLGYEEYGVSNGAPVLFFHGTPGARVNAVCTYMDSMAKKIDGPSIRLIAMDRPGYGLSDAKQERTMDDTVLDVIELMDQLGINQFSMIGLSGGGPYALATSANLRERVKKIALICSLGPVYIPELMENLSQEETATLRAALFAPDSLISYTQNVQKNPDAFVKNELKKMSENDRKAVPSELIQGFIQMITEGTKNPEGMISDYKIYAKDWGIRFEDIKVPVHLWHSESDQSVPIFHSEYLVNLIPNSTLTRLQGFNHVATSLAAASDVFRFILD
jgi:pimeloyl-ACP methyl ester carboxylesterase